MENTPHSSSKNAIIAIIVIVVVIAIVLALPKKSQAPEATPIDTPTSTPATTKETDGTNVQSTTNGTLPVTEEKPTTGATTSAYKDGTYTAAGTYRSPAGTENVSVTLTLTNDVITDITATPTSDNNTSKRYQAMFVSGYKALVIGKKIDTVQLDKVSGSSLTGAGFNAAVSAIKTKARS